MLIRQLELGSMSNFVYLVADPATKEGVVVDPGWDVPAILKEAQSQGVKITRILLTHGHSDHVNGVAQLLSTFKVPVSVHQEDSHSLEHLGAGLQTLADGDKIRLGASEIRVLHPPGHSPGSVCYLCDGLVLTGDTLFIGECGRVDLPGSVPEQLYHSLRKLAALPDDTRVYPGHNYGPAESRLMSEERTQNRYIMASLRMEPADFVKLAV